MAQTQDLHPGDRDSSLMWNQDFYLTFRGKRRSRGGKKMSRRSEKRWRRMASLRKRKKMTNGQGQGGNEGSEEEKAEDKR